MMYHFTFLNRSFSIRSISRRLCVLLSCYFLIFALKAEAQSSSDINISIVSTPQPTPCSGIDTFVIRVSNISSSAISSLNFLDSMPAGINYVSGSVSGSGVSFGSTIVPNNVVSFSISSIPASGTVDVRFAVATNCSVSSVATNIFNKYKVSWGTGLSKTLTSPYYTINFPSLSISIDSPVATRFCRTPFVRKITICNGGYGSVDSVILKDDEANTSLVILNFSAGSSTGLGTKNAKTVLKAIDFSSIGNFDGKLDNGECIEVYDTLKIVGSTSPISGVIRADWGCNATNCANGTTGNIFSVNTFISSSSAAPSLSRYLTVLKGGTDSAGNIYGRPITYQEIVKNNSSITANSVTIYPAVMGLKYIVVDSIWASYNAGPRYHPTYYVNYGSPFWFNGTPAAQSSTIIAPSSYTGKTAPNNTRLNLGDIDPGDSIIVTFEVRTAGPISQSNNNTFNHCSTEPFCSYCYRINDGPSISAAVDAQMAWQGCPAGSYAVCAAGFPQQVYNGASSIPINEPNAAAGVGVLYLARFRGFSFKDSTANNRCAYYKDDTLRLLLTAGVMDLPFYTDKSKFFIRLKLTDGIQWDGNLARTFGRLSSWSASPWYADRVVDQTAIDSTIEIYFKRSNCPIADFTTKDIYNSYRGGQWQLAIGLINTCPGAAQKRVYMTRNYTIDTTSAEGPIESGGFAFQPDHTWNSICSGSCTDGVSILNYSHARSTFGQADNDNNGIADTTGTLNLNLINTNLITWSDTLKVKYRMVVHSTATSGLPYLYLRSSINYSDMASAIACNTFLKKTAPQITIKRPGIGSFSGTGSSTPVDSANTYLVNLSLQGTGGISILGVSSYLEGDTLDVIENIVYWTPHYGWGLVTWSFLHVPYMGSTTGAVPPDRYKCDSVVCNFQTIDMQTTRVADPILGPACSDSTQLRYIHYAQTESASCGSSFFPYEVRDIIRPSIFKMVIPAGSKWSITSIDFTLRKNVKTCAYPVLNQPIPTSLYSFSGDTVILNGQSIAQYFGNSLNNNNLLTQVWYYFHLKYTPSASEANCVKDHSYPRTSFVTLNEFTSLRPMDSSSFHPVVSNTSNTSGASVYLNWPGPNNNTVSLYAGSSVSVTKSNVIVPIRYNKANSSLASGNDFIAIPSTPGITIDSVKDKSTGAKVVSITGSDIYKVGYLALNTSRDFDVYTTVNQCVNDMLLIYADRSPCSGYPSSWAAYSCKSNANVASFTYNTFEGELQMKDSLYSTLIDMCSEDTVAFKVNNSQTQDAFGVKIRFVLPANMSLVTGHTQLSFGSGSFVSVSDPSYSAGVYTWILPSADTLRKVSSLTNKTMTLRCGIISSCGYVSGSQIKSSIGGNVACGPITSLFNANPPALDIIGAPLLSYFTNVKAQVSQADGCSTGDSYPFKTLIGISGGATSAGSDSIKIIIPIDYSYVSYSPTAAGSKNAPSSPPLVVVLADGTQQLSWQTPSSIAAGDSIIFTFQYKEKSTALNKCPISSTRMGVVNTFINSIVPCASTGSSCTVSIPNGTDTMQFQSRKPSISTIVTSASYVDASAATMGSPNSKLYITGSLKNSGTAAVAIGKDIIMEPFMDLDNSGTVTSGDYAFSPFIYSAGLEIDSSIAYSYVDSMLYTACTSCKNKNLILRFSNNPSSPSTASQCFCDSFVISSVSPTLIPLGLTLDNFGAEVQACNKVRLYWRSLSEPSSSLSFKIRMSTDGSNYTSIADIPSSGQNNSEYARIVDMPQSLVYYQIEIINGPVQKYSNTIAAHSNCWTKGNIKVYPNPFNHIIFVNGTKANSRVRLIDAVGRTIAEQTSDEEGNLSINISEISAGIYLLNAVDENGLESSIRLRKE